MNQRDSSRGRDAPAAPPPAACVEALEEHVEADDAPEERGPLRTCVATRVVRPVEAMLRFVLAPDGGVVVDLKHKLPGRGVWVTATNAAVREAVRRKAFARGFRKQGGQITVAADLPQLIEALLEKTCLQSLSIANKAGAVVCGAGKVEDAIAAGKLGALIHASDARPDGVRKLRQLVHRAGEDALEKLARVELFDSDQLSLALGRSHVIHAAVDAGGACRAFLAQCRRLALYRTGDEARAHDILAEKGTTAGEAAPQSVVGEARTGVALGSEHA